MAILDRYIISSFVRIFLICLVSFAGLYVVVDAFTNLDEFLKVGHSRSLASVMPAYYTPRVLQFFDKTAAILALVAAVFCLAVMQRSNELTAIQASGISNRRIVRPVLFITAIIVLAAVVNREFVIPRYRGQLVMNAQDIALGKGRTIGVMLDRESGVIIRGQEVFPAAQEIILPAFILPRPDGSPGITIDADSGTWHPAGADYPAGYLLQNVAESVQALNRNIVDNKGNLRVAVPADDERLRPNEAFVASQVDTIALAYSNQLARNASLTEMVAGNRRGDAGFTNQSRVAIHARIVQPVFDLTILLIGLPLVIARGERNLFLSAGICLCVVLLMSLVTIVSHALGGSRIINPPALAAWLPLIVFGPVAWVVFRRLR